MRRTLFALAFAASTLASAFGFEAAAQACAPAPQQAIALPGSDDIEIYWGGSWVKGDIIQVSGNQFRVRYDGWSPDYDEWVDRSRIRQAPSAYSPQVDIYWGASWYPGVIVEQRGGSYLVHYDGWSNSFDEWVGAERLSFRGQPVVTVVRPRPEPVRPAPLRPAHRPRGAHYYYAAR